MRGARQEEQTRCCACCGSANSWIIKGSGGSVGPSRDRASSEAAHSPVAWWPPDVVLRRAARVADGFVFGPNHDASEYIPRLKGYLQERGRRYRSSGLTRCSAVRIRE